MLSGVTSWILSSKVIKTTMGGTAATGLLGLIFNLHSDVVTRIEKQDVAHKEHIQLVIKPLERDMKSFERNQNEIKQLIRDIHRHLLKTKN